MGAKVISLTDRRRSHPAEPAGELRWCAHGAGSRRRRASGSQVPPLRSTMQRSRWFKSPGLFAGSRPKPKARAYGFALLVTFVLVWTVVALGL
jgi:hypothetical protein